MMDTYFITVVILGAVILLKTILIICIYVCRAKRRHRLRMIQVIENNRTSSYPTQPYTARSPILEFEETPQPIIAVSPDQIDQVLPPGVMQPPPYSGIDHCVNSNKPPSYDEAVAENTNTAVMAQAAIPPQQQQQQQQQQSQPPLVANLSGYPQTPPLSSTPGYWPAEGSAIQLQGGGQQSNI